jgi:hypothetical protein
MKRYDAAGAAEGDKGLIKDEVTVEGKPLQFYLKTLEERASYIIEELNALDILRFARILVGIAFLGKELPLNDPLRPYDILGLIGVIMQPRDLSDFPLFL